MGRLSYFFKRLVKMDWKAMWKTTGLLKERSGKSRMWLMADMLRCAIKYNAGYIDYKIAQMYRLNDAQRATVITRGISNSIVRRMGYANEISRLNNEIEKYRAEYEENTERLNELAVDSGAIERIAREKYLMKKPNEDIYVFEEDIEK